MTREEALKVLRENYPHFGTTEPWLDLEKALATLIPELAESEDERMCTRCIDLLRKVSAYSGEEYLGVEIADCIIWLQALIKKLKESLHITEICKEDADSFTDEDERIRAVILKLVLGMRDEIFTTADKSVTKPKVIAWLEKQKELPTDAKQERVIKAARRVLNNWLYGDVNADVSGDLTELEYAFKDYDGEEEQKEQKPAEWKPQPESLEALMYAIEGKWDMISPTSYLSRRLEDLYEGLVNTYNVDESLLAELPKTAYTAKDIEELKALKDKIDASMDKKPEDRFEEAREKYQVEWSEEEIEKTAREYASESPGLCRENDGGVWLGDFDKPYYDFMAGVDYAKSHISQPKQEWSDEDESSYKELIHYFESLSDCLATEERHAENRKWLSFLKSLRPSWKPSEEQMDALSYALQVMNTDLSPIAARTYQGLQEIHRNLRKLM